MLLSKTAPFFKERRLSLMARDPGAVFIFAGHPVQMRSPAVQHEYRQDSNFHYLSGFPEAGATMVLSQGKMTLFVEPRQKDKEIWTGEIYGPDRARSVFGADQVFLNSELSAKLADCIKDASRVYYTRGMCPKADTAVFQAVDQAALTYRKTQNSRASVLEVKPLISELRLHKSKEEVEIMKSAGAAATAGHLRVMQELRPGMNERQVQAILEYEFKSRGCARPAYGTIVAGGTAATCLHYVENNADLKSGDLLLIDAGGEFEMYASDVTRTMPVGPNFSREQALVYDAVCDVQLKMIQAAKVGTSIPTLQEMASLLIAEHAIKLGLASGNPEALVKTGEIKRLYPHGLSHYLGLDVHDVGPSRTEDQKPRALTAGNVITIEPGIYIQPDDVASPPEFRGIGVRIEDDILITSEGREILNPGLPKLRSDVEDARARAF